MTLSNRKRTRMPEYEYSAPGAYFITIARINGKRCSELSSTDHGFKRNWSVDAENSP